MGEDNIFDGMPNLGNMFKEVADKVNESQAAAAQSRFHTGEHLAEFAIAALNIVPVSITLGEKQTARWAANVAIHLNELLLSHMAQQEKPKGGHDY